MIAEVANKPGECGRVLFFANGLFTVTMATTFSLVNLLIVVNGYASRGEMITVHIVMWFAALSTIRS